MAPFLPPYERYPAEAFLRDALFCRWVTHPDPDSEQFWRAWLRQHPHRQETVAAARHELLRREGAETAGARLSAAETRQLWQRIRRTTAREQRSGQPQPTPPLRPHPYRSSKLRTDMFRHYFTIALRNLVSQKVFSLINTLGLAIGMGVSMLIFLWVRDERGMDRFHARGPQLFSVYHRSYVDGKLEAGHFTAGLLPDELKRVIPEVAAVSGFVGGGPGTYAVGDKIHKMHGGVAGADFFRMFSYPLLLGNPETALNTPASLAISRKMAELYFGSPQAAMGKLVRFDDQKDLMVTAVFENLPARSSDQFDCLWSWVGLLENNRFMQAWKVRGNGPRTYVQLRAGADPARVEAKLKGFLDPYLEKHPGYRVELGLQPFGDKYLYSDFASGTPDGGRITYVRLFTAVAVFTLLIACINFMNLSTARAARRAREVGVRKVLGGNRLSLAGQFIGEAVLVTLLAACIALLGAALLVPGFNLLTGKSLSILVPEPAWWLSLLGLVLVTGLVAGSYPAFFLSSLQPVRVLKGSLQFGRGAVTFRRSLVVLQFALSILLIIATLVVSLQTEYVQSKHLGYDRENLLYLEMEGELAARYSLFKQEVSRLPGIRLVDRTAQLPYNMGHSTMEVDWEGKDPGATLVFTPSRVGYDYAKVLGLKLAAGRDFSRAFATDSSNYLVNEEAVRQMGFRDPVGKSFTLYGKKGTIIGVLKDYHVHSLHEPIKPLVLGLDEKLPFGLALVRAEPGQTTQALRSLEQVWKRINPAHPFAYSFLDEEYEKLYRSEQVVSKLSRAFAGLAILVSCLGLLGLSMFSAEQRRKEMGVRKVLGAPAGTIITLFTLDLVRPVAFAFLIAAPVAWFAMRAWLGGFAYRIELAWWIFALAGASALLVALLTVSIQAVKAASLNPVKSLRSE